MSFSTSTERDPAAGAARKRRLRWIGAALGLILLLISAVLTVRGIAARKWRAALQAAQQVQAALAVPPAPRPVLVGPETTTPAGSGYAAALRRFQQLGLQGDESEAWRRAPGEADAACWQQVGEFTPVLRLLRAATRSPDGRLELDPELGFDAVGDDVLQRVQLLNFMLLHAWRQIRDGAETEGIDTLLDALQFGRDHLHDRVGIRVMIGADACSKVAGFFAVQEYEETTGPPPLLLAELSPSARRRLRRGLETLDQALPPLAEIAELEAVLAFASFSQVLDKATGWTQGDLPGSWRFGFSERWMMADMVLWQLDAARQLPPPDMAWPQARAAMDVPFRDALHRHNPLVRLLITNFESIAAGRRRGLASLRLLQMMCASAEGQQLSLPDPFGGKLKAIADEDHWRFWSRDHDGVDDGGSAKKDLLLQVPRRR